MLDVLGGFFILLFGFSFLGICGLTGVIIYNHLKKKDNKKYKPYLIGCIVVLIASFILTGVTLDSTKEEQPQTVVKAEKPIPQEKTPVAVQKDSANSAFINDVKKTIDDQVGSGDSIKDVTLKDKTLYVVVNLNKEDPAPLTMEDLAISRTRSITDAILDLSDYDDLWDKITIDFGDIGKITNGKNDIEKNEFGMRYFPSKNFILQ